jgi:hypothetical protein
VIVLGAPVVDWGALGEVILVSLVGGVGVALAFSLALLGAVRSTERRRAERPFEASLYGVLGLLGLAVTLGALVMGIVVMTTKG